MQRVVRKLVRITAAVFTGVLMLWLLIIGLAAAVNPPTTAMIIASFWKGTEVKWDWIALEDVPEFVPVAFIAAEDANFCRHWGFDADAIRASGTAEGASISQQTVRYLLLGDLGSAAVRAIESMSTVLVEMMWSKRRIIEVYLNSVEFGDGIFGIEAASQNLLGKSATDLDQAGAALLAASRPAASGIAGELSTRSEIIRQGMQLISAADRSSCIAA